MGATACVSASSSEIFMCMLAAPTMGSVYEGPTYSWQVGVGCPAGLLCDTRPGAGQGTCSFPSDNGGTGDDGDATTSGEAYPPDATTGDATTVSGGPGMQCTSAQDCDPGFVCCSTDPLNPAKPLSTQCQERSATPLPCGPPVFSQLCASSLECGDGQVCGDPILLLESVDPGASVRECVAPSDDSGSGATTTEDAEGGGGDGDAASAQISCASTAGCPPPGLCCSQGPPVIGRCELVPPTSTACGAAPFAKQLCAGSQECFGGQVCSDPVFSEFFDASVMTCNAPDGGDAGTSDDASSDD
jgi:hypothetical protein